MFCYSLDMQNERGLALPLLVVLAAVLIGTLVFAVVRQAPEQNPLELAEALENLKAAREILIPGPLRKSPGAGGELIASAVISHTNNRRIAEDLSPLTENEVLNQVAQAKIDDMLAKQYFEHISPEGIGPGDLIEEAGYEYVRYGENLAMGGFATNNDLVEGWMNSPPHRESILSEGFTEIGVAVQQGVFDGQTTWLAVQTFGKPLSDCTDLSATTKNQIDALTAKLRQGEQEIAIERSDLAKEWEELLAQDQQASDLQDEGNALIAQGNAIAEETGSNEAAQSYWEEGEAKQQEALALIEQLKQKKTELEDRAGSINDKNDQQKADTAQVNALVEQANKQIRAFQACLEE